MEIEATYIAKDGIRFNDPMECGKMKNESDMTKAKASQYCVTALNRPTMERDIVTPPCSYDKAKEVVKKFRKVSARDIPYLCPRIAVYSPENINI